MTTERRSGVRIRPLEARHLGAVVTIEAACFGAEAWPREAFMDVLRAFRQARGGRGGLWIAEDLESREIVGYVGLETSALRGEADIINIAVGAPHRRQGVARALLDRIVRRCRQMGIELLWLRVRASNQPARRFYRAMGFEQRGTFVDYYRDPDEPAVLMAMDLD